MKVYKKRKNIKSNVKNRIYKLYKPQTFINKIIKRDIIVYSILIISLIFLTSTTSYAYLTTELNTIELENVVSANIEGITLNNSAINISSLIPSDENNVNNALIKQGENKCKDDSGNTICSVYEFFITNEGNTSRKVKYSLNPINNTFSNLKFKIFSGTKDELNSFENSLMISEKLTPNINKLNLTGLDSVIKPNGILNFTVIFWIDKTEEDQTIMDAGKSFYATLLVDLETSGYSE